MRVPIAGYSIRGSGADIFCPTLTNIGENKLIIMLNSVAINQ